MTDDMVITHFCKVCEASTEAVGGTERETGAMISITRCQACGKYGALGWSWARHPKGTLLVGGSGIIGEEQEES